MRVRNGLLGLLIAAAAGVIAGGCSSAPHKVADEDLSADWSGEPYGDLLVVGVYEDRAYRIGAESTFAEILKNRGVDAAPSYDLLPRLDSLDSEDELAQSLVGSKYDGLLVVATLDEGYDYGAGDYFATRGIVYLLGGRPGAATNTGSFIAWAGSGHYELYVGLWDAKTLKQVWEIETSSKTTGSETEDTEALAKFVHETLRERGLIPVASAGEGAPAER